MGETMKAPYIIVDIGSNHRNSIDIAFQQIESAKECQADAVKFQLFTHLELYGMEGKLEYELPREWLPKLKEHADKVGIDFMCSAFSPEGVALVDPYVSIHKLASSEALDPTMHEAIRKTKKPVIISTGALSHEEVFQAQHHYPLEADVTLLECVANYPADIKDYNLLAMNQWQAWGVNVGLSDHCASISLCNAAVGFGAKVFEFHFDCRKITSSFPGMDYTPTPDSPVSLGFGDAQYYVECLKDAFEAVGNGHKSPAHQHQSMLRHRRRPIVTMDLLKGDILKFGVNYGLYRSLVDDTHGAPAQAYQVFDGKKLIEPRMRGQSLYFTDIER